MATEAARLHPDDVARHRQYRWHGRSRVVVRGHCAPGDLASSREWMGEAWRLTITCGTCRQTWKGRG